MSDPLPRYRPEEGTLVHSPTICVETLIPCEVPPRSGRTHLFAPVPWTALAFGHVRAGRSHPAGHLCPHLAPRYGDDLARRTRAFSGSVAMQIRRASHAQRAKFKELCIDSHRRYCRLRISHAAGPPHRSLVCHQLLQRRQSLIRCSESLDSGVRSLRPPSTFATRIAYRLGHASRSAQQMC